jgi:hypothetical protein
MKYTKDTLKYLKNNILLLLPCYVIAVVCLTALINFEAYQTIAQSISKGSVSDSFLEWLRFFTLFNPENVFKIIAGIVAYVILILDLAFIHSLIDNHVRFGSRSIRSIASSFNINVVNSFIFTILAICFHFICGIILAAIMKTCELIPLNYSYIFGLILSAILMIVIFFVCSLFMLWLPCVEITGFRKYEALNYSYALARQRVWKIFVAFAIPSIVIISISIAIGMTCHQIAAYIAMPLLIGLLFIYTSVMSYMVYADAEGIEREDLRKY